MIGSLASYCLVLTQLHIPFVFWSVMYVLKEVISKMTNFIVTTKLLPFYDISLVIVSNVILSVQISEVFV